MICRLICRISTPTTGKQDDVSSSVERKVFKIVLSLVCLLGLNFFGKLREKVRYLKVSKSSKSLKFLSGFLASLHSLLVALLLLLLHSVNGRNETLADPSPTPLLPSPPLDFLPLPNSVPSPTNCYAIRLLYLRFSIS